MEKVIKENMKKKRLLAIGIDFLIMCLIVWIVETIINLIVEPILPFQMFALVSGIQLSLYWLLCKDCYKGMSPGKYIMGIQIINQKNNLIAGQLRCIIRNLFCFFGIIEFIIFITSPKGLRIGDYLTSTRVVNRNSELHQKLIPVICTYIIFFSIWIIGIIIHYLILKTISS